MLTGIYVCQLNGIVDKSKFFLLDMSQTRHLHIVCFCKKSIKPIPELFLVTVAEIYRHWTTYWNPFYHKQVAQRATIAHLSPMCQQPLISNKPASKVIKNLNSFQIREQLFFQGLVPPMSAV